MFSSRLRERGLLQQPCLKTQTCQGIIYADKLDLDKDYQHIFKKMSSRPVRNVLKFLLKFKKVLAVCFFPQKVKDGEE